MQKQQKLTIILSDIIHLDLLICIFPASWYYLVTQQLCEFPIQYKSFFRWRKQLTVCFGGQGGRGVVWFVFYFKIVSYFKKNVFCLQAPLFQAMETAKQQNVFNSCLLPVMKEK